MCEPLKPKTTKILDTLMIFMLFLISWGMFLSYSKQIDQLRQEVKDLKQVVCPDQSQNAPEPPLAKE
jgi:hypothetical protein